MVEKVLFWDLNFKNIDFDYIKCPLNLKIIFLSTDLCVIQISLKQNVAEIPNLIFTFVFYVDFT